MERVIIEVPTLGNRENIQNGSIASALIVKAFKNGTTIPKDATNGDVINALFPNIEDCFMNVLDLKLWWKSPYNAESEDKE